MGGWAAVYMSPAARAGGDADVTFVKALFAYVNLQMSIKLHLYIKMLGLFVLNCG